MSPAPQTVEKPLTGFSDKFLQSAARTPCSPMANNSHTCSLRCIFCQVHAPTENDWRIVKSSATQYHKRPHREISNLNIFWGGGS